MTKIVQGLWIGSNLTDLEIMCIRSFQHHGHEFHLYTYGDIDNIPSNTIIKDANKIIPKSSIYKSRNGGLSSFADYFRWTLLDRIGGLWVDMDVICLRPFDYPDDVIFGWESKERINIAVLEFPPGHFLPRVMARACDDVNLFQPTDKYRTVVKKVARNFLYGKEKSRRYAGHTEPGGPPYFTRFVDYYGLTELAKPPSWFYPFPYWEWKRIFFPDPDAISAVEGSYAVHVWHNAMNRTPGMDKSNFKYDDTLIGMLRERYLT